MDWAVEFLGICAGFLFPPPGEFGGNPKLAPAFSAIFLPIFERSRKRLWGAVEIFRKSTKRAFQKIRLGNSQSAGGFENSRGIFGRSARIFPQKAQPEKKPGSSTGKFFEKYSASEMLPGPDFPDLGDDFQRLPRNAPGISAGTS